MKREMKNKVIKFLSSTAISLVCIIGTMVLTANCGKDDDSGKNSSCPSGYSSIAGNYSSELACLINCSDAAGGKIVKATLLSNGTCCCEK